ncbi:enoyl-CoA hydratase/isomerase family protein [Frankia sp. CNm7]|uniref:Enoyl-CoA hydratase/isomerase family protein n=1 Tax=Frankia nepalensis TaxID=1836974 RepID=A0A937RIT4_9ACTN|nr:enoyl-CoA hydratase-related protein [Frankia nepalensis]MBL7502789.1 enoyl-CoA hydratase/isomerase family protein [Frankia nepalensis]MBL7513297.1 enoyl-CoA hydratase/isomerase family protein [Frankia nepalensis]MBL7518906.1 enoyl-CoA hydratase/isomerase family protein [Frankia nepalensis]MBL7627143.1 enoyl-CoA hydratase/isomerase family protein [Frankia nepalensis]
MTSSAVAEGVEGSDVPPREITLDITDGIATITLNRPDAGNALTGDQRESIISWLDQFNEDPTIRCVVLTATGRFFCTGADLRNQAAGPVRPDDVPEKLVGDVRRNMTRGAIRLIHSILDCEKPVVAAVNGTAAGIGAHIAFACDIVIATEKAKFIEVFARRGLAADGLGTWLLPRLVGLARARELILLAEDLPAARAAEIGLITRAVPADEFAATVAGIAGRLAEGPTRAHSVNKWLLNRSLDTDRHSLAQEEAWIVDVMSNTVDAGEGVASFVERRPTRFRGY